MILKMNNAWNLMDEFFEQQPRRDTRNMKIEDDVLIMEFDVPGLSKKDINVKVEDTILSIEGDNEKRTFNKRFNIQRGLGCNKNNSLCKGWCIDCIDSKGRRKEG